MTDEKLYPVDYDETKEAPAEKPVEGQDTVGALALIRAAVPKGGKPLDPDQLVALVCGRYVRGADGAFLPMAAAPDASLDLAGALEAVAAKAPLRGPAAFASLTHDKVKELIAQVADERRATWKLKEAVAVEVAVVTAVEEKPE